MRYFTTLIAAGLLVVLTAANAAVRGDEAMYVGGTLTVVPEKTEGRLDMTGETAATFTAKKGSFAIPFKQISSLEYGQKAGRRVGLAVAVSPLALFSKKKRHFLTVGYVDEKGERQGAVFEISKGKVKEVAAIFEAKSGQKIEFESEEARKNLGGKVR